MINGFLSKESHGTNPVYIGIYSNPCKWEQITGSVSWAPTLPYNWSGAAWTCMTPIPDVLMETGVIGSITHLVLELIYMLQEGLVILSL